jgi:hypothetical protein
MSTKQTKYSSLSTFQRGVADVNEKLTDGERMVMNGLAVDVDYEIGESRPGNTSLMRRSNRTIRAVQEILKQLRAKGLLQMVSKGDGGRGLATIHRFCVEDDRYLPPDTEPKPRSKSCGDKDTKPRSDSCGDNKPKPRSAEEKPRSCETETPQLGAENPAAAVAPLPYFPPVNPSSHPSSDGDGSDLPQNPKADREKIGEKNEADELPKVHADAPEPTSQENQTGDTPEPDRDPVNELGKKFTSIVIKPFKCGEGHGDRLTEAIATHGIDRMIAAITVFANDGHDWAAVKSPAAMFLSQLDDCLNTADAQNAVKLKNEKQEQIGQQCAEAAHAKFLEDEAQLLQKRAEETRVVDEAGLFGGVK